MLVGIVGLGTNAVWRTAVGSGTAGGLVFGLDAALAEEANVENQAAALQGLQIECTEIVT